MPPYMWMCPICLDAPYMFRCYHMFGCTPCKVEFPHMFVWPPAYLDAPISLDIPCMFGCPPVCLYTPMFALAHMFGCLLYVWVPLMFGHLSVWLGALHMFGAHVCLDATKCMGAFKGMRDIQTYGGCPNIQGHPNV